MNIYELQVAHQPQPEVHALHLLAAALLVVNNTLKEGFENMANDFSGLKNAIGQVEAGIRSVSAAIANPAVDNNDQSVIDALTAQLNIAADALAAATAAENVEDGTVAATPAPVVDPTPAPTPAPVDGTAGGTTGTDSTGATSPDVTA